MYKESVPLCGAGRVVPKSIHDDMPDGCPGASFSTSRIEWREDIDGMEEGAQSLQPLVQPVALDVASDEAFRFG